jgi:hypothetical protein
MRLHKLLQTNESVFKLTSFCVSIRINLEACCFSHTHLINVKTQLTGLIRVLILFKEKLQIVFRVIFAFLLEFSVAEVLKRVGLAHLLAFGTFNLEQKLVFLLALAQFE